MSVTAYCVSGTTKSGQQTRPGIVAADPRVLPLGSVIRVEGVSEPHEGTYTVADTGAAVKGHIIDIYIKDCAAARRFGRQEAQVSIESLPETDD
jgi:3D (Asp-Asp-Asp) domain-containing protein